MNDITDIAEVYDLLYRLGFSATNTAFFQLSYAVYHNFGTPLIGSVFLSNHILPRFEFLGKWRIQQRELSERVYHDHKKGRLYI